MGVGVGRFHRRGGDNSRDRRLRKRMSDFDLEGAGRIASVVTYEIDQNDVKRIKGRRGEEDGGHNVSRWRSQDGLVYGRYHTSRLCINQGSLTRGSGRGYEVCAQVKMALSGL